MSGTCPLNVIGPKKRDEAERENKKRALPRVLGELSTVNAFSLTVSMRFSTLLLGALGVCAAQAAVIPPTHVVHEKRHALPRKWVKRDRILPEAILPIRIGLRQRNLDQGHSFLMDVYVPQ
jgi:hypothetical protein